MDTARFTGFGIGLRPTHYQAILASKPHVDWFEIISEDFLIDGGAPLFYLDNIRRDYPMAMHGVSLSIGSCDPLNKDYLSKLRDLAKRVDPLWISDHLCWTGVNGVNIHDLMPIPYTEEAVRHIVLRVKAVQDYLGRQLLLENVSSYVSYQASEMTEWEFLSEIAKRADCLILLDINNIFVNAFNHRFNPFDYLNAIPVDRVRQFHLAGHDHCGTHIIDTHDSAIISDVWDLYEAALNRFGSVATLIERDANIPALDDLLHELDRARSIHRKFIGEGACVNIA